MARPNQKLVAVLSSLMELGHSLPSMRTALDSMEEAKPKRGRKPAVTKRAAKPASKKKPAQKQKPKRPAKPKVPKFFDDFEDADLVEFAEQVLEDEKGAVKRAFKKGGRGPIIKKLLTAASVEDLETWADEFFGGDEEEPEDEVEEEEEDDEDFEEDEEDDEDFDEDEDEEEEDEEEEEDDFDDEDFDD